MPKSNRLFYIDIMKQIDIWKTDFLSEKEKDSLIKGCLNKLNRWFELKNTKIWLDHLAKERTKKVKRLQYHMINSSLWERNWYHLVLKVNYEYTQKLSVREKFFLVKDALRKMIQKRSADNRYYKKKYQSNLDDFVLDWFGVFEWGCYNLEVGLWDDYHIHILWYTYEKQECDINTMVIGTDRIGDEIPTNAKINRQWNKYLWLDSNVWGHVFIQKINKGDEMRVFNYILKIEDVSVNKRLEMYKYLKRKRFYEPFWELRNLMRTTKKKKITTIESLILKKFSYQ